MRVDVRFVATFRGRVGRKSVVLTLEADTDPTVLDALERTEERRPALAGDLLENRRIASTATVLRNGRFVDRRAAADVPLDHGDELTLSPPLTGG